jgi:hypothetical protein
MQKESIDLDLVDDKPQVINTDLRKFNSSKLIVVKAMAALAAIVKVETKAESDSAISTLKEASTVEKKIEAKRKELVAPFNDAVKKINGYAKELVEKLPLEITRVKNEVVAFQKAEEEKRMKLLVAARTQQLKDLGFEEINGVLRYDDLVCHATVLGLPEEYWIHTLKTFQTSIETKKQLAVAAKQQELEELEMFGDEEEVAAANREIEQLQAPTVVSAPPVMEETTKVKGITKRWTFEVTDATAVPREYLVVDETKIRQAITGGERLIPGVRIYQTESLTLR